MCICVCPKTFFYIVQLLERGSISGDVEGNTKLLEIVPPPVSLYLPENAKRIGKGGFFYIY